MKPRTHSKRTSGQAAVEFALVLPILVLLLIGIYDFACAIRAHSSISNMSREGANLASRPSAGMQDKMQDIMNVLAVTAQPLDMKANGMIFITVVQGDTIQSQDKWQLSDLKDSTASRVGTPTASESHPKAQGLVPLALGAGQTAYVVEVFYNYKSLFSGSGVLLGKELYSRTVF